MSDQTTTLYQNCSSQCAEMLGGNCPGAGCIYAPVLALVIDEPWMDWRLVEQAAHDRGARLERRNARIQQRQSITFGFWLGVITVFAALLVVALIQWWTT